jgi:type I restriction enzyme R subunit
MAAGFRLFAPPMVRSCGAIRIPYFDAVKIGFTATPAPHTTALFGPQVFHHDVELAILDGFIKTAHTEPLPDVSGKRGVAAKSGAI